jgi:hypothetical protein
LVQEGRLKVSVEKIPAVIIKRCDKCKKIIPKEDLVESHLEFGWQVVTAGGECVDSHHLYLDFCKKCHDVVVKALRALKLNPEVAYPLGG